MMLLLKTDDLHFDGVRRHRKHATDGIPQALSAGDTLLIQVTYSSMAVPTSRVKAAMTFVRCYEDGTGECKSIWGRNWRYIIEGKDWCTLRKPFDVDDVKVSSKNYGQGVIRFAYIDPADEAEIRRRGLLVCA
jgi:hypothetical protein